MNPADEIKLTRQPNFAALEKQYRTQFALVSVFQRLQGVVEGKVANLLAHVQSVSHGCTEVITDIDTR